ncbi:hypothetical protein LJC36_00120 [Desulfovibrio sp. OttesenSCG-928-C14]|nr:hypothetical protein [Desulfovibrio sp. OttesenSCG-928-C14]
MGWKDDNIHCWFCGRAESEGKELIQSNEVELTITEHFNNLAGEPVGSITIAPSFHAYICTGCIKNLHQKKMPSLRQQTRQNHKPQKEDLCKP